MHSPFTDTDVDEPMQTLTAALPALPHHTQQQGIRCKSERRCRATTTPSLGCVHYPPDQSAFRLCKCRKTCISTDCWCRSKRYHLLRGHLQCLLNCTLYTPLTLGLHIPECGLKSSICGCEQSFTYSGEKIRNNLEAPKWWNSYVNCDHLYAEMQWNHQNDGEDSVIIY